MSKSRTLKACVIQPHNDDAVISIGGILSRLVKNNWAIEYLYVTDSQNGGTKDPGIVQAIRDRESSRERKLLSINKYTELGFIDQSLGSLTKVDIDKAIDSIGTWLVSEKPFLIFIPSIGDRHPDHVAVNQMASRALQKAGLDSIVIYYSVWLVPDFYNKGSDDTDRVTVVGIDSEWDTKLALIRCHRSQLKRRRYDLAVNHLSQYYARILKADKVISSKHVEIIGIKFQTFDQKKIDQFYNSLSLFMDVTEIEHGRGEQP